MIRVRQVSVLIGSNYNLKESLAKKLNISISDIKYLKIHKRSIDARFKPKLYYVYELDVILTKKVKHKDIIKVPNEEYIFNSSGTIKLEERIVIVGAGPAGLFAAYLLSQAGFKPLVIDRGEMIEKRVKTVEKFWKEGILNKNSNVQFGEGGAGTFSDGKLNSQIKDKKNRIKKMLDIFIECGAKEEIAYIHNPHIGTDNLRQIVINMRHKIMEMGGEFLYNTCLTDIHINNNQIESIEVNNNKIIKCSILVLALGHSARDTFEMLLKRKINIVSKPFAIGVRIQNPQSLIDQNQYGTDIITKASYKLTYKASNNRGVYSFCMCPGGYVVNASSEEKVLVINGMSNYKRDSGIANSAIIVTVNEQDYGKNPLDGIKYQQKIEKKAYEACQGKIPTQLYGDFKQNKKSVKLGNIKPMFKGDYELTNLNAILPDYICDSLKEGIDYFDKKINGIASSDTILSGVETRTSSPIRIVRDETFQCNIKGIYPCGEGSGYAGGITSSAVDGMKIAEAIASIYKRK